MLVDEVEVEESVNIAGVGNVADGMPLIGVPEPAQNMPRGADGEEQQEAGEQAHLAPAPPLAGDQQVGNYRRREEDRGDESLGQ